MLLFVRFGELPRLVEELVAKSVVVGKRWCWRRFRLEVAAVTQLGWRQAGSAWRLGTGMTLCGPAAHCARIAPHHTPLSRRATRSSTSSGLFTLAIADHSRRKARSLFASHNSASNFALPQPELDISSLPEFFWPPKENTVAEPQFYTSACPRDSTRALRLVGKSTHKLAPRPLSNEERYTSI